MKIKQNQLAQFRHVKFLMNLEKQSRLSYKWLMGEMLAAIKKKLKQEKLTKSEDDKLGEGWTGEVPQISLNAEEIVNSVIGDYLQALRWIMLGDYAGPAAKKAAKKIGVVGKVTPGLIPSAYLQSMDAHREHHAEVMDTEAPEVPTDLIKESLKRITKRADRFVQNTLDQIRNSIIQILDQAVQAHNTSNLNKVMDKAHDLLPEQGADAVSTAAKSAKETLNVKSLEKEFDKLEEATETKWQTVSQTELASSSAIGTHQAMYEIYGNADDNVRVVWMMLEDEKTCDFCRKASRGPDGKYKYYKISDFKPTGFNYGKKKSEWQLTIPPAHPRCRCDLVYVPRGFEVNESGDLVSKK